LLIQLFFVAVAAGVTIDVAIQRELARELSVHAPWQVLRLKRSAGSLDSARPLRSSQARMRAS
jgi:hypothetical protein